MLLQIEIGLRKRFATEKAAVGGKGRRVGRFENEVFFGVDERFFRAGVASPENKNEIFAVVAEVTDGGFGENLPTATAVRAGAMSLDGEDVVQEKNALVLPRKQVAGVVVMGAEVGIDFFIDVDERRRDRRGGRNREGETVGGAWSVIGVLAENDDFDGGKIGGESGKNLLFFGENGLFLIFFREKGRKFFEIGLLKFGL